MRSRSPDGVPQKETKLTEGDGRTEGAVVSVGAGAPARTRRLIEEWMPIAALSEESVRERRSMTALPPTYYLHVWWARRPLVASRAAVLASLLPDSADRKKFMHVLGIHGDPVASRARIEDAKRTGVRFEGQAYSYPRAFSYAPTSTELRWFQQDKGPFVVLDSTAGGGSIPHEALRLGCRVTANDLNPVAWLVLKTTVEFPARFGAVLVRRYHELAESFVARRDERLASFFPPEREENRVATNWLWARTVTCPYCGGLVPLSPNWKLNNKGLGVRMEPRLDDGDRRCTFELVETTTEQSAGTVKKGDAICPFPDCGRVFENTEIQAQAQSGKMGEQLYAVVYAERQVVGQTKSGKPKHKKTRGYRAPGTDDDVADAVNTFLAEKMPEWEARGIVPTEPIPEGHKTGDDTGEGTDKPLKAGMRLWRDMFSRRQLLGHCISVEVYHEMIEECGGVGSVNELDAAALSYIALTLDKMLNYNSRLSVWMPTREVVANTFNRHDFAFCWSHAEMSPTITGLDYDWAIKQTGKAMKALVQLAGHDVDKDDAATLTGLFPDEPSDPPSITITRGSGDDLPFIEDGTVDAVVLDPPYEANVMYAELSDFFYVWLKRTAGLLFPEEFADLLTDKDREAVANPAKFKDFSKVRGSGGAKKRAVRDYQERMQAIFAEAKRVLKPCGIMTVMFTHKASGAWDALAKGLVEAGFVITASWPIQTEAEGSLHIKEKNAAKSTIFLVCRPRDNKSEDADTTYWEEVEPKVKDVVLKRVVEFQEAGIGGVDLYLSCFGPALQVFSEHWPMIRGRAAQKPLPAKGAQLKLLEDEEFDPYAVRPEDALMAARAAVKEWRLAQIATLQRKAHLDPVTEWFVLAWDAFKSPRFRADEALKLARVVGVNFDEKLRGRILEVKGDDVILWDSAMRSKKGSLGAVASNVMLDALHHAARAGREKNTGVAKELIERAELERDSAWLLALQAVLEVLPTPRMVSSNAPAPLAGAAADADALEKLRKLVFSKDIPKPKPWVLFDIDPEEPEDG